MLLKWLGLTGLRKGRRGAKGKPRSRYSSITCRCASEVHTPPRLLPSILHSADLGPAWSEMEAQCPYAGLRMPVSDGRIEFPIACCAHGGPRKIIARPRGRESGIRNPAVLIYENLNHGLLRPVHALSRSLREVRHHPVRNGTLSVRPTRCMWSRRNLAGRRRSLAGRRSRRLLRRRLSGQRCAPCIRRD
jgi:hypothetical protein